VRGSLSWLVLLLAGGLLLPAATDPPEPLELPETERQLTLESESLSIKPSRENIYLLFSGEVTVTGEDYHMSADVVELDINPDDVLKNKGFSLPKMPEDTEHIVQEPSEAIAEMGYELQLPNAQFSESSLRRVAAAGNVRVESEEGVMLTTEELISTDGGRSWASTSRSRLSRDDADGNHAEVAADYLLLDVESNRALARGNIEGSVVQVADDGGNSEVTFNAQSCEYNLEEKSLSIREGLEAHMGSLSLCCGTLLADLENNLLYASDTPHLLDSENGVSLDAYRLEANITKKTARAEGDVWISYPLRSATLSAGRVDANLEQRIYTATGSPELHYGDTTYTGQQIKITLDGDKTVIEVEGPQYARINVEELSAAGNKPD